MGGDRWTYSQLEFRREPTKALKPLGQNFPGVPFASKSMLTAEAMMNVGVALLEDSIVVFAVDSFEVLLRDASDDEVVHSVDSA